MKDSLNNYSIESSHGSVHGVGFSPSSYPLYLFFHHLPFLRYKMCHHPLSKDPLSWFRFQRPLSLVSFSLSSILAYIFSIILVSWGHLIASYHCNEWKLGLWLGFWLWPNRCCFPRHLKGQQPPNLLSLLVYFLSLSYLGWWRQVLSTSSA